MSFDADFAAVAPNRWQHTTGPANGEFPLIRLTGTTVLTGVDGNVAVPIPPIVKMGYATVVQVWRTDGVLG